MRLIDANKIPYIVAPIAPILGQNGVHYEWISFREDIDHQPTASQWISVEDRLPEYQEKVLCFYENGFMGTAVFYGISADPHKSSNDFASYSHDYMTENSKIKFWMPLPEPPKENEDETD